MPSVRDHLIAAATFRAAAIAIDLEAAEDGEPGGNAPAVNFYTRGAEWELAAARAQEEADADRAVAVAAKPPLRTDDIERYAMMDRPPHPALAWMARELLKARRERGEALKLGDAMVHPARARADAHRWSKRIEDCTHNRMTLDIWPALCADCGVVLSGGPGSAPLHNPPQRSYGRDP